MECKEICEKLGKNNVKVEKFQNIFDGNSRFDKFAGNRLNEDRITKMIEKLQDGKVFRANGLNFSQFNDAGDKHEAVNTNRVRESQDCKENYTKNNIVQKQEVSKFQSEYDACKYDETKKSLSRIKKTQDLVKKELRETKSILEERFSKIEESYRVLSSEVQELGHLVELGRFVNNKTERIKIKERLKIALTSNIETLSIEGDSL